MALLMFLVSDGGAGQDPVPLGFDGKLDGFVAYSGNGQPGAAARFVDSKSVPGTAGKAVALGVLPEDAAYLAQPLTDSTRLGASYSIAAWINPVKVTDWSRLVLNWGRNSKYAYHLALRHAQVSLCHGLPDGKYIFCEGGNVLTGRWQQVACVADRNPVEPSKSQLRVYLNGQKVGEVQFDGTYGDGGDEQLTIGDSCGMPVEDNRFRGYVDSLKILKRPMSDKEVVADYELRRADLEKLYGEGKSAQGIAASLAEKGEIIFAERNPGRDISGHYYANFGYDCGTESHWMHGADGGRLAILDPVRGEARTLIEDAAGAFRDPAVHYDGKKVLFSYRKGGTHHYNLYEITLADGKLTRLTAGDWDDVEPTYLPDGGIAFCSTRCRRYVLCWLAPVAILHRCNSDGSDIRQISSGAVTENTPAVLPDGRILYTRWEYVNRDAISFHHLWVMNPDGTGAAAYYGNMHPGGVFIDARPVPASDKVVFVDSGYHGSTEHAGRLMMLKTKNGPDDRSQSIAIPGDKLRDPYPLSESEFLAARGNEIVSVSDKGAVKTLYKSAMMVHEPRLIVSRRREPVIPSRVDMAKANGTVFLSNVYVGRNMKNVKPGSIKKLLVMEQLPKPVNFHGGGTTPLAHGGKWTLNRILGTVDVEPDGSASFEVPACRSIYLAALDENNLSVKQMRSFFTVMPGEHASCIGCHEDRTMSLPAGNTRLAAKRQPARITPIAGIPEIIDFPRDIQPILDRHCVSCHNPDKRAGNVDLCGARGTTYSISYYNLMLHRQVKDTAGLNWEGTRNIGGRPAGNDAPYEAFSSAAPLMKKIDGTHHDAKLPESERTMIRLWLDSATPYSGTYAAYGTGQIGGWWRNNEPIREMADSWPSTKPAADAVNRRCAACHPGGSLPRFVTDSSVNSGDGHGDFEGWCRPVFRFSRHHVFNLTEPAQSLMLKATLAKQAGGYAEGKAGDPQPLAIDLAHTPKPFTHPVIFENTKDADYQALLAHIQAGKVRLDEIKRFDMPGFRPHAAYIQEMKRYKLLPDTFDAEKDRVNVYEMDNKYFDALIYRPLTISAQK